MAGQQRTKADKARAQYHRQQQLSYSYQSNNRRDNSQLIKIAPANSSKPLKPFPTNTHTYSITDLFAYDVRFIYRDLVKTGIITGVILAVLIGIRIGIKV